MDRLRFLAGIVTNYIWNILIALSQLLNAVLAGDPDETFSSRLGKHYHDSFLARIVNRLFFWQKDHVKEAIEPDEGKDSLIK